MNANRAGGSINEHGRAGDARRSDDVLRAMYVYALGFRQELCESFVETNFGDVVEDCELGRVRLASGRPGGGKRGFQRDCVGNVHRDELYATCNGCDRARVGGRTQI